MWFWIVVLFFLTLWLGHVFNNYFTCGFAFTPWNVYDMEDYLGINLFGVIMVNLFLFIISPLVYIVRIIEFFCNIGIDNY